MDAKVGVSTSRRGLGTVCPREQWRCCVHYHRECTPRRILCGASPVYRRHRVPKTGINTPYILSFPDQSNISTRAALQLRVCCGAAGLQGKHEPEDGAASLAVDAFLHKNTAPPDNRYGGEDADNKKTRGQPHPHGVFHAHAHDMAYLEEWIREMLNIWRDIDGTAKDAPKRAPPP